jgi:hypothetical protein
MAWPARLRLEKLRDKSTRGKRKRPSQRKRSRPPKRPFLVTGSALASGYVGASNVAALATDDEAFSAERLNCAICGNRLLMIGFLAGLVAAAQQKRAAPFFFGVVANRGGRWLDVSVSGGRISPCNRSNRWRITVLEAL